MTDVLIDILCDPQDPLEAFEEIQGAIEAIQEEADKAAIAAKKIVPPNGLSQTAYQTKNLSKAFELSTAAMNQMRIGSSVLTGALRSLIAAGEATEGATLSMKGALIGAATSAKGFLAAIGPIGWALIAASAALKVGSMAWRAYREDVQRAKEAQEQFEAAEKSHIQTMRDLEIEYIRATGTEYEYRRAIIEETYRKQEEAAEKYFFDQTELLRKSKKSLEEYNASYERLLKESVERSVLAHSICLADLDKLEKEHAKAQKERIDAEEQQRRKQAAALVEAVRWEQRLFGMSEAAMLKRKLLALGMDEAYAQEAATLKEKLDLMKQEAAINEGHATTMEELNWQIEMNNAVLEGNIHLQTDLLILKKMNAGLSRQQAEEQVAANMVIDEQTKLIREMNKEKLQEVKIQEELNAAQRVGLDQMYEKIATAAAGFLGTGEGSTRAARTSTTGGSSLGGGAEAVLEKIYDLLERWSNGPGFVGVLG